MKKLSAFVLICLTAMVLSACSAFHDESTQTFPLEEPYTATVFLQLNQGVIFTPELLTTWKADVERIITANAEETTLPKITAVSYDNNITAGTNTFPVELTLSNVPASTSYKVVRPFKIYYTQTIYNPIALLPANANFTYIVGFTFDRRHSWANTEFVSQDENGEYTYLWTSSEVIEIKDVYPNRTLYYVIIVAGALAVGVVVYLIKRYSDCKKQKISL